MNLSIDINCDMGEGFGWDEELMPYITSANIACGFHAGDAITMQKTVALAVRNGVAIGAHPSLHDRENFGRKSIPISPDEAYAITLYQLGALQAFAKTEGASLHHVKPHGALYTMAARDASLALAIAKAVADFNPELILYGLANSTLITAAKEMNLAYCHEVFADRTYQRDGLLTPRDKKDALIESIEKSISQALQMIRTQTVTTLDHSSIRIQADTVCVHGDGEHALPIAKALYEKLKLSGVRIAAP